MDGFSYWLAEQLTRLDWTQRELAEALQERGESTLRSTVSRWLSGHRPSRSTLPVLLDVLEVGAVDRVRAQLLYVEPSPRPEERA